MQRLHASLIFYGTLVAVEPTEQVVDVDAVLAEVVDDDVYFPEVPVPPLGSRIFDICSW